MTWLTNQMKICNNYAWIPTVATNYTTCSKTSGTISYDGATGNLAYCYAGNSYSMKGPAVTSCVNTTAGKFNYDFWLGSYKYCNGVDNQWHQLTTPTGYIVRTSTANLFATGFGSLGGANTKCVNELNSASNFWLGKDNVGSSLPVSRVTALLCDNINCQNAKPSTLYKFAVVTQTSPSSSGAGGSSFTSDTNGLGPNDAADWSGGTYFGTLDSSWTGRAAGGSTTVWPNTPAGSTCSNWNAGTNATNTTYAIANSTGAPRWSSSTVGCSASERFICLVTPDLHPGEVYPCTGSCVETFITSTAQTTWTVPANWSNTNNKIEVIGGGGGGNTGTSTYGGGGGAGGGYSSVSNITLTASATINIRVGTGGTGALSPTAGGATWFGGTSLATSTVGVNGGGAASTSNGGAGGTVAAGVGYAGGNGGPGRVNSSGGGGGGGGAAGPFGAGGNSGGVGTSTASGGGGNGGGTPGSAANATNNSLSGAGGANVAFNGGVAGTTVGNTLGGAGTVGGGGAGSSFNVTGGGISGGGGNGIEYSTKGSGGGGGGGSSATGTATTGGAGGLYGGGGAGGGNGTTSGAGGAGGQGLIRITYTP